MNDALTAVKYPPVRMLINGQWEHGSGRETIPVHNPSTGEEIGRIPVASSGDLTRAVESSYEGMLAWNALPQHERYLTLLRASALLHERREQIGALITLEEGKPLSQGVIEATNASEVLVWFAEEGRRIVHEIIPCRLSGVEQRVNWAPIGPVAAFTPWNFPVGQAVRKIAAALAAGCSIVLKGPEETPASCEALVQAFVDAGVPAGALNLVFGVPSDISNYLISHPIIRKISFTGSTVVGKQLAQLAGAYMKPATMELGGHAPVLIFGDADIDYAIDALVVAKYRNAGQVCTSPTRFIVHTGVYDEFLEKFVNAATQIKVGDGFDPDSQMGPLAHGRRLDALNALVDDAVAKGSQLRLGGKRIGNRGYYFEPTVLAQCPIDAKVMNEEPFGPLAIINSYPDHRDMIAEANRLQYGLAAYAYSESNDIAAEISSKLESGMLAVNHQRLGFAEVPFGGLKDSGYGTEGGTAALDAYLVQRFVTTKWSKSRARVLD